MDSFTFFGRFIKGQDGHNMVAGFFQCQVIWCAIQNGGVHIFDFAQVEIFFRDGNFFGFPSSIEKGQTARSFFKASSISCSLYSGPK